MSGPYPGDLRVKKGAEHRGLNTPLKDIEIFVPGRGWVAYSEHLEFVTYSTGGIMEDHNKNTMWLIIVALAIIFVVVVLGVTDVV